MILECRAEIPFEYPQTEPSVEYTKKNLVMSVVSKFFKISRGNSPHFNGEMKARLGGEFFPNNMEYFPVFKSVLL